MKRLEKERDESVRDTKRLEKEKEDDGMCDLFLESSGCCSISRYWILGNQFYLQRAGTARVHDICLCF